MLGGARNTLPRLTGMAAMLLLAAFSGLPAQEPQNRRILDIELSTLPDKYRIVIQLDEITRYSVTPPRRDRPMKIELGSAQYAPTLRPKPSSNALIRSLSLTSTESGLVTITCDLASTQVEITDFKLQLESLIIVDLRLKPGTVLEAEAPPAPPPTPAPVRPTPPAQTPTPAHPTPTPRPAHAPEGTGLLPALAPPQNGEVQKIEEKKTEETALAEETTHVVEAVSEDKESSILYRKEYDYFPYDLVALRYRGADKVIESFESRQYLKTIQGEPDGEGGFRGGGLNGLRVPQSPRSLESLLYLLAESHYQMSKGRQEDFVRDPEPDWPSTLNYYHQAIRHAPRSKFRPFAEYRLSQIYSQMGDIFEAQAVLYGMVYYKKLPELPQVLYDFGVATLALQSQERNASEAKQYLSYAETAFEKYLEQYPDSFWEPNARYHLGEIYYRKGMDARAFDSMRDGLAEIAYHDTEPFLAHQALAGHRVGILDLVNPKTPEDLQNVDYVNLSMDPADHNEYARMLDEAGDRRGAMRQYNKIITGLDLDPESPTVLKARIAMVRYAQEDLLAGGLDPGIPWEDYMNPADAVREILKLTSDPSERDGLFLDQARLLFAQGKTDPSRYVEAIKLMVSLLEERDLSKEHAAEMRKVIWDVVPKAIEGYHAAGEKFQTLRLFSAFKKYLQEHPKRNEVLISTAQILVEDGWREQALEAVEMMDPYRSLSPEVQAHVTQLNRELRIDPSNAELVIRAAPRLLEDEYDHATRARALRMLGETYSAQGRHDLAESYYMLGPALTDLSWQERADFYLLAAREDEAAQQYSKALGVYFKGLGQLEEEGIEPRNAHDWIGLSYLGMGENFQRISSYSQAITAYKKYLEFYPKGAHAQAARYHLAQSYDSASERTKALEQYNLLAKEAPGTFWSNAAQVTAKQLVWEEQHPYAAEGAAP